LEFFFGGSLDGRRWVVVFIFLREVDARDK